MGGPPPIFSAVSSSTRWPFQILRCISFASKVQVSIGRGGVTFTAEESRVMQGQAFLDRSLFTNYVFSPPPSAAEVEEEVEAEIPPFQISLSSLLETLQILGIYDAKDRWAPKDPGYSGMNNTFGRDGSGAAFDTRLLGMRAVCRFSYAGVGEPLCIILEEAGVTTTCELTTYEPEDQAEIPLQKDAIAMKVIMGASWLYDAITELSSTSPTRLTVLASPHAPFFALSAVGPLGSATVEFNNDPQLLEIFAAKSKTVNAYKFSLVKSASKAMALATKVSIRGDEQGVLSLQFMVDDGEKGFIDFRFVPYVPEEGDEDELEEEDEEETPVETGTLVGP
ncbi:MAG: ssDNA endodeoxyribonuclease [Icmadophila ericetorum]|nr:ssDNA endodeoxyribonuclease [Icmadophila ericetorum]